MDEFGASLALRHARGLGPRTWKRLLDRYGSASGAVSHSGSWVAGGLVSPRVQSEFSWGAWREKAEDERRRAQECGFFTVFFCDPAYPQQLREIPDVRQAWRVVLRHCSTGCGDWLMTWGCKSPVDPDGGNH